MNYPGVPEFLSMSKMLQWSILSWMENFGVVKLLSYKGYTVLHSRTLGLGKSHC